MHHRARLFPASILLLLLAAACSKTGGPVTPKEADELRFATLEPFGSDAAYEDYLQRLQRLRRRDAEANLADGTLAGVANAGTPASADNSSAGSESITNNQEAGVDEGDIVKVRGRHLVVLRRGRLFSVDIGEAAAPMLRTLSAVPAYPQGATWGSWYDELLVYEQSVVVIGYSYQVGATEIGFFNLDAAGQLSHRATYFLRSNDYFSSRNYASRLVDGNLIFYMPYYFIAQQSADGQPVLPALGRAEGAAVGQWNDIVQRAAIYRPVQSTIAPALHTVVRCDLKTPEPTCTSTAVLGPASRTFYVSQAAVYLWVGGGEGLGFTPSREATEPPPAHVYRMPLDGSAPGVVQAQGVPVDQFSLKEDAGVLYGFTQKVGVGDAFYNPELARAPQESRMARIPLDRFTAMPQPLGESDYDLLPVPGAGNLQNRFVGDYFLYASSARLVAIDPTTPYGDPNPPTTLYAFPFRTRAAALQVTVPSTVERIEPMGQGAALVGTDAAGLRFSSLALGAAPAIVSQYGVPGAQQGETRSHGFFYRELDAPTSTGLVGLPIRMNGTPFSSLVHGSAEVVFLRTQGGLLSPLGKLRAMPTTQDDACTVSCVDWYGNARPIFYQDRIFALLGYELVEGLLQPAGTPGLIERQRVEMISSSMPGIL